jgi:hypothetical protein
MEEARITGTMDGAPEIAALRALEEAKYQVRLQGIQENMGLLDQEAAGYAEKYAQMQGQIETLTQEHNLRLQQLDIQAWNQRLSQVQAAVNPIVGAMSRAVMGLIERTMTFRQAFQAIMQSILQTFINILAQMLAKWIATKITEMLFGKATTQETAKSEISAYAATGGAAAGASVAAIPYYGWAAAIPTAYSVYGGLMAFQGLAAIGSAEGGWENIPEDQLAMVHRREMVLPADLAQKIRLMTDPAEMLAPVLALQEQLQIPVPPAERVSATPSPAILGLPEITLPESIVAPVIDIRDRMAAAGADATARISAAPAWMGPQASGEMLAQASGEIHVHMSPVVQTLDASGDQVRKFFDRHGPEMAEALGRRVRDFQGLR